MYNYIQVEIENNRGEERFEGIERFLFRILPYGGSAKVQMRLDQMRRQVIRDEGGEAILSLKNLVTFILLPFLRWTLNMSFPHTIPLFVC